MKRIYSILFSLLVFLSGMHISLATHYCQGKIAATKFSFSAEKASCGMDKCTSNDPVKGIQITSNCCIDEISAYSTDNNFTSSYFQLKKPVIKKIQVFLLPAKHNLAAVNFSISSYTNTGPPGNSFIAEINLPEICVFRI